MNRIALTLGLAALLSACAPRLRLAQLPHSDSGSIDHFLDNMAAVSSNLNGILNVHDAPERYSKGSMALAQSSLPSQIPLADDWILRADSALAADLPRTRKKMMIAFPRFATRLSSGGDDPHRRIGTAQAQILAYQYCLLNLKTAVDPATTEEQRATWEKGLADARVRLKGLRPTAG